MSQRVLIVGATSAIASEVARIYAARGARLYLLGRNGAKLAALVESLGSTSTVARVADFAELGQVEHLVAQAAAALGGIDVALIAHGDLGDQARSERHFG